MAEHEIRVEYTRGMHELLTECVCGWTSQWQPTSADARHAFNDHVQAKRSRECPHA